MKEIMIEGAKEKIYYDETENGLPIYMWVNDKVNDYYMTLNVKYGSIGTEFQCKNDKEYIKVPDGIAHFLEHMKFNNPDMDVFSYFENNGAGINAFTGFDITAYEVYGTTKFTENLNCLLDYVYTPFFPKDAIKKERGVITEEIKMDQNNPYKKFINCYFDAVFHHDKRKYPVIGSEEEIKKIDEKVLQLVFDTFYHPKNMFMIITGNFNPYEASATIKENMKQKEFAPYQNPKIKIEKEPATVHKRKLEFTGNVNIPKVRVALKIPKKNFKTKDDLFLGVCLKTILRANFGTISDFREKMQEEGIVLALDTVCTYIGDYVLLSVIAETKYPEEFERMVIEQFQNLTIDAQGLKRRKRALISMLVQSYDDIEYVNSDIQNDIIHYGKLTTDWYQAYQKLKMEDVQKILESISTKEMATIILRPEA